MTVDSKSFREKLHHKAKVEWAHYKPGGPMVAVLTIREDDLLALIESDVIGEDSPNEIVQYKDGSLIRVPGIPLDNKLRASQRQTLRGETV